MWIDQHGIDSDSDAHQHPLLASLGPEPLTDAFTGTYLHQAIQTRSTPIKTTIMDAHLVVGVGNIYASESLFRARIHPETPAKTLTRKQCERLTQEIKQTLIEALEAGGSSLRDFFGADGNPGYFQQSYFVYGQNRRSLQSMHKTDCEYSTRATLDVLLQKLSEVMMIG